jgi:hypothetical protein
MSGQINLGKINFVFPLGGHSHLNMLNTTITYNNIPIETWIQLIQNNFIGIDNVEFVKQRYKLDCTLAESTRWFKYTWKHDGIFVFYKDVITRDFWDTISRFFKTKTIVGLTRRGVKDDNIVTVQDLNDVYEQDRVCRFLNKFLLQVL